MTIANVQLGTSETTILLSGAAAENAIVSIFFCNTSAATRTITLYAYPSGGSAGDSTTIAKDVDIASYDTWIWTGGEKFLLGNSAKISGLADLATSVTATVNYQDIT